MTKMGNDCANEFLGQHTSKAVVYFVNSLPPAQKALQLGG
jgi:hypothetical protein